MSNSMRVESPNEYVIEVNDNGDTISFDLTDINLSKKAFRMYEQLNEITVKYEKLVNNIEARPDKPYRSISMVNEETGETEDRVLFTQNQYDSMELTGKFFTEARAALDSFLGEGACTKIFGEKNYYTMFNDLFEQLQPHFKKMGVNADNFRKSISDKYSPTRQQRRKMS